MAAMISSFFGGAVMTSRPVSGFTIGVSVASRYLPLKSFVMFYNCSCSPQLAASSP